MTRRVLLLGGTTEATAMARALADAVVEAVYSYAGRTEAPATQPIPVRIGGFGGPEGLAAYLAENRITHVIDATHPFAATMSGNAVAACASLGLPLIALERPVWTPRPGDRWHGVPDVASAVAALPDDPARVFLGIGRQHLGAFAAKPQHHYLLRLVDPPAITPLPGAAVVVARGPFDVAGDTALLRDHAITQVVAKNAGGTGAVAKIDAARALGLPVIMIDRPSIRDRHAVGTPAAVMDWLGHADLGV